MPGAHPLDGTSKLPSPSFRSPTDLECAAVQRGRPSGTPGHPDVQVDQTEIKSEMKVALGNKLLKMLAQLWSKRTIILYYYTILLYYDLSLWTSELKRG